MVGKAQITISYDTFHDLQYAPYACLLKIKGPGDFDPVRQEVTYTIEADGLPDGDNGKVKFFIHREQTKDTVSFKVTFEPVA